MIYIILKYSFFKGSQKLLPFLLLTGLLLNKVSAQVTHGSELGFGLGVSNYSGDLSEKFRFKFLKPSAQAFYKYNFKGDVSVLRINLLYADLDVDESKLDQSLQQFRRNSFQTSVVEAAVMYEYNFFNFRDLEGVYFMAPYMFVGLGGATLVGTTGTSVVAMPMGVGIKMMVSRHINIGVETGARLAFGDMIDGIDDEQLNSSSSTNDWYYSTCFTLSYTWYRFPCPQGTRGL